MNGSMKIGLRDVPLLHDTVLCAHTPCLSCTLAQTEQQLAALTLRVEQVRIDELRTIVAEQINSLTSLDVRHNDLCLRVEALEEAELANLDGVESVQETH